jgi:pimeloyl-ACP methyl ester carboxylesterase
VPTLLCTRALGNSRASSSAAAARFRRMMALVEAGGLRIAYEREGAGRPIVFLHGFFGDHRVWRRQRELADQYTFVAWDAPGCGASAIAPEGIRMPEFTDLLAEFIDRLGLAQPHLVGNSFGGTLALQLASRHPELARSVVGIDTYAGWSGSFNPEVVVQRLAASLPDVDLPPDQVAAKWVTGFVTPDTPEPIQDEVRSIIADFKPRGMRTMIQALAEADLRKELKDLHVPTLLVWGAQDVRSPITVAHDLQARIEGSRLVIFERAGHLAQVEAAERLNAELRAFFRSVDASS